MKRILNTAESGPTAGVTTVACPQGKKVRVLSVFGVPTGVTGAEQVQCQMTRTAPTQVLWHGATNQLTTTAQVACFFLGGALNKVNYVLVDPGTGVVSVDNSTVAFSAPLPNIWWTHDVTVVMTKSPTSFLVLYETEDAD